MRPEVDLSLVLTGKDGNRLKAAETLFPLLYRELRELADAHLQNERPSHTLQPTALVHEAYLRLVKSGAKVESKADFLHLASVAMRRILVNHARDRNRLKRGGGRGRVPLDDAVALFEERAMDLIALDEALDRLGCIDPRRRTIVELRFFGGLSVQEAAQVVGVSVRTVEAEWATAKMWLRRELTKS